MDIAGFILDVIAIVVSVLAIIVSTVVSIATLVVSNRKSQEIAKEFGDVAGTQAAIRYEEQQAAKARIAALQSLVNEVERIRKLVDYNSSTPPKLLKSVVRMPVAAFETAFVSGRSGLAVSEELLGAVTDYLTCADMINVQVGIYVAGVPSGERAAQARRNMAVRKIHSICADTLPEILDRLGQALEQELETSRT